MGVQIVLCLETRKQAATDYVYISETIKRFYAINNQTKISPIYMESKARYNSPAVLKEIKQKKRTYVSGETKIIYCIDTDRYEMDMNHSRELSEVSQFCQVNGYDLIWFCHDIEEVYLGKRVTKEQKVKEAGNFRRKSKIQEIAVENLTSNSKKVHRSNILIVLDQYMDKIQG